MLENLKSEYKKKRNVQNTYLQSFKNDLKLTLNSSLADIVANQTDSLSRISEESDSIEQLVTEIKPIGEELTGKSQTIFIFFEQINETLISQNQKCFSNAYNDLVCPVTGTVASQLKYLRKIMKKSVSMGEKAIDIDDSVATFAGEAVTSII